MKDTVPYPPSGTTVDVTIAGRYTLADIARILLTTLTAVAAHHLVVSVPVPTPGLPGPVPGIAVVLVVGAAAGVGLAEYTVDDLPVDQYLRHYIDHRFSAAAELWPDTAITDAVIGTDTGTVVGMVQVPSVNMENLSTAHTRDNLRQVNRLCQQLNFPVKLVSTQRRMSLDRYAKVSGETIVSDHYVTVCATDDDIDDDQDIHAVVDDRCRQVQEALAGADMYAERLAGDELGRAADRVAWQPDEVTTVGFTAGGEHRQVLYVAEYPAELAVGWLADILTADTPGLVDIVQTVRPATDTEFDELEREVAKAKVERMTTTDPHRQREMEQVIQDIEDLIDAEMQGDPVVQYGIYVVVRGDSKQEVATTAERVRSVVRQVDFHTVSVRMWDAVRSVSPLFDDHLDETMMVAGVSAAGGFPWAAFDTIEESGVLFGIDEDTGTPVVLDPFAWSAPNISVMGKAGSGKTFFVKLLLLRVADRFDDVQVLVLDLKPGLEYGDIAAAMDTTVRRWRIGDRTTDDPGLLARTLQEAYEQGRSFDGRTVLVVDEAHRVLDDAEARGELEKLVREGRKHRIAVVPVTQNTGEFLSLAETGTAMLAQIDCNVLFYHKDVDDPVEEYFRLSEREASDLRRLAQGTKAGFSQAVVTGEVVQTTIRVEASEDETAVIDGEHGNGEPDADGGDTAVDVGDDGHSGIDVREQLTPPDTEDQDDSRRPVGDGAGVADNEIGDSSSSQGQCTTNHSQASDMAIDNSDKGSDDARHTTKSAGNEEQASNHGRTRGTGNGVGAEDAAAHMELPDPCVTVEEHHDDEADVDDVLPEVLPGWKRVRTTRDRWQLPVADDYVTATYVDPVGDRYIMHVSRWQQRHVRYAVDELYGRGRLARFDAWTARGRFVFGVKVLDGSVQQGTTLLAASPALSQSYVAQNRGKH